MQISIWDISYFDGFNLGYPKFKDFNLGYPKLDKYLFLKRDVNLGYGKRMGHSVVQG